MRRIVSLPAAAIAVVAAATGSFLSSAPRSTSADARPAARPAEFEFDVRAYGAVGDNEHDDTAAFQAAFDDAAAVQGRVLIPPPASGYKLTAPVIIKPATDRQLRIDVDALGGYSSIVWHGPSDSSVFITYGLKDSTISGVKARLAGRASGVVVWDMRVSETYSSYSNVLFRNCFAQLGDGGRNIAWRSTPGGGFGDFATMHWQNCYVQGSGMELGDVAWQNGTTNSLPWTFTNCFFSMLWRGYLSGNISTNTTASVAADASTIHVDSTVGFPPAGTLEINGERIAYTGLAGDHFTGCSRGTEGTKAAAYEGAGYVVQHYHPSFGVLLGGMSFYWYGGGGSGNANDFTFTTAGCHSIFGGRFENGQRFLRVGSGAARWAAPITIEGCDIREYQPPDGIVFDLRSAVQLRVQSCNIGGAAPPHGASMIRAAAAVGGFGSIYVADSVVNATDPFFTLASGRWRVAIDRVTAENPAGVATGYFRPAKEVVVPEQ